MITSQVTFVLLTERRSQGRQTPDRPVETGRAKALWAARARFSAVFGFRSGAAAFTVSPRLSIR